MLPQMPWWRYFRKRKLLEKQKKGKEETHDKLKMQRFHKKLMAVLKT
jgi:hypothetical protein